MSTPMTLDVTAKQNVEYAIPLWLRDEQCRLATARVKDRISPHHEVRTEPAAIVCYGPSLNDTWEQVRDFKHIFTCSGSHKFLLDRQIVPTAHIEVDPRAHKVLLMGPPHPDVTYYPASTCHPKLFDHLEGFTVKLWHVFDNEADAKRALPHGEWAVTGGCSVGLRALTIAGFLGFRDLRVFGMDGAEGPSGKHAAAHPNQPKGSAPCEYDGVTYQTTPAMLAAAQQTWHELDQMPSVHATFYGEGLVQAMARHYVPKPRETHGKPFANVVGFIKPELISAGYRKLNEELHRSNLAYGVGGGKHAATVLRLAESIKARSILDYGCGKSGLAKAIPFGICEYDPAIPGKQESPKPADLVIATDVLEHIEPERIDFVLADLKRVTLQVGFFTIHTGPAQKILSDGRNAHVLQRNKAWWIKKLRGFFEVGTVIEKLPELYVVVGPKRTQSLRKVG